MPDCSSGRSPPDAPDVSPCPCRVECAPNSERETEARASLEPQAATGAPAGAERAHARVVGQRALDGRVGQHDELVDALCQRPQLPHGGAEQGIGRIDLLGDDDEPHVALAATACPTSSTTRSAYSSAVYAHSAERA